MTAPKKRSPKSPTEQTAAIRKKTQQSRRTGSNTRKDSKLYSKQQFLKDLKEAYNTTEEPLSLNQENRSNPNHMATSIRHFGESLIKFAKNPKNRDITSFFILYDVSPKVFYKLMDDHESLENDHSMATACFSYNNLLRLDQKGTNASHDAAKSLHQLYSPERRRLKRQDIKFEASIRALAMEELIDIKKQLAETKGTITVKVEY